MKVSYKLMLTFCVYFCLFLQLNFSSTATFYYFLFFKFNLVCGGEQKYLYSSGQW